MTKIEEATIAIMTTTTKPTTAMKQADSIDDNQLLRPVWVIRADEDELRAVDMDDRFFVLERFLFPYCPEHGPNSSLAWFDKLKLTAIFIVLFFLSIIVFFLSLAGVFPIAASWFCLLGSFMPLNMLSSRSPALLRRLAGDFVFW